MLSIVALPPWQQALNLMHALTCRMQSKSTHMLLGFAVYLDATKSTVVVHEST